ncbi:Down syndrome cell adhesion molecule-like protein Dscam2 [Scaptodrosophila lebanonensis]|uniref:Down syndrome cell adhesion molecule-like protein Dscam2 n=1 Tax=Drosophila lebanonensis TaxID=7225 RepID=A0A6J2U5L8_DROLE|nr:Down syndrome cell adhesion molecule-like protein Dscam2 [Scaptodrosophila lebanonensis]
MWKEWLAKERNNIPPIMSIMSMSFCIFIWIISVCEIMSDSNFLEYQGPSFSLEPPNTIEFMNTVGNTVNCIALGNPEPILQWLDKENNPITSIAKVRHILANNSLYLPPFEAEDFRQDVHWSVYRCRAANNIGAIISRDIVIKAVVQQRYEPEVQNPGGFIGSNVLIKCNIPSFVKDYVTVTSWFQEPNFNIFPSLEGDGKNHMLPSGDLIVYNITRKDAEKSYRCRTHHKLTKDSVVSINAGKIQLTEMRELVPPIINEKTLLVLARSGDPLAIPCVAYANPKPVYKWHTKRTNNNESVEHMLITGRAKIKDGTFVISVVENSDNGIFYCTSSNTEGSETLAVHLSVTSPLSASIHPSRQTINLGQIVDLICTISGYPKQSIVWLKDGKTLRAGARVRLMSKEHIRITSIVKEDRGMYQCVVKNDLESIQSSAELRLGEVAPQLLYKFIEQTMQPGPSVSLKCSASGNPTPKIIWLLDGFPLSNNDRLLIGQYVTTFNDVISHVNISAVKSEDGGVYECKAVSRAGEVTHAARLNIYGMPYIRHMEKMFAVAGKTFVLKCPISGFPIENITIEKDGLSLPVNIRQRVENGTLTIENMQRTTDQGTYTCIARNKHNYTSQRSVEVKVLVPPKITPFSFARDLTYGDRTSIQCVVGNGDLPLIFTWLKNGEPLLTVPTETNGDTRGQIILNKNVRSNGDELGKVTIRQNDDFTSALSISSVTRAQSGTYTCRVQNDAATVTHSALLEVNVPPRWILKPTDQDAILGNLVIITCKADGFPVPVIQWKQSIGNSDYREISRNRNLHSSFEIHNNGSLIIPKVDREHEGSYLCQASNGIGAGLSTLIKLTVHVGPSVTVAKKQITVRRGERIALRCDANGDEPLNMSWRAKAYKIDPSYDTRYHIKHSPLTRGLSSELTILQTILADRGEYSCIAGNAYGQDRAVIHLHVQEPPNFPINLRITDLSSRSVTLAWSSNDQDSGLLVSGGGNNLDSQPISNYILQYKKARDVWHEHTNQKLLPGHKTTAELTSLRPAEAYHFRLFAENHLGTSAPSDILLVQTEEEAPSKAPEEVCVTPGIQELLITWHSPERESWNGDLLGYTIAYKNNAAPGSLRNYTKVSTLTKEGLNEFRLTGLEKYTEYAITVSAFNIKGDSPPSEVVLGHTLEDVPSAPPQRVSCIALTAHNIQISWHSPPKEASNGIIQGYKLLYEPGYIDNDYGATETKITSALSTVLHGLHPFTNYSVQVLAFTHAGEGVVSPVVSCMTEEAVPDAPERIKSVVSSNHSVIVSWLPPRRPNGIITKYNVYIRILDKGLELKIIKEVLPSHNQHFEARDLNLRETYEAWVTASTRVGQGPSTPVIKLVPSTSVPAAIISFSQTLSASWRADIKLTCVFVGNPKAKPEWKVLNTREKKQVYYEISSDNTLSLRNVQRSNEGNYSCMVRNTFGSDQIVYQLYVQVPPSSPIASVTSTSTNSVSIQWRVEDMGGSPLKGFTLNYRHESSVWKEIQIDRRVNSFVLENLRCGTQYQLTINTFNKIGTSETSSIVTTKTKGNIPVAPYNNSFIRPNVTSALLELSSWQDGGCPITHFSIEFKLYGSTDDWIIVSNRIELNTRYNIGDLEPHTAYNLRITAHNNAGSASKQFFLETLNLMGLPGGLDRNDTPKSESVLKDAHLIALIVTSIFGTILALIGALICFKNYPRNIFSRSTDPSITLYGAEGKDIQHSEHFYGTVHKSCQQYPLESVAERDRIPEFSEDIYPYATFNLPDHQSQSGNISLSRKGNQSKFDPHCGGDGSLCSSSGGICSNPHPRNVGSVASSELNKRSSEERHQRPPKVLKSESEEYDSLNSESDLSGECREGGRSGCKPSVINEETLSASPLERNAGSAWDIGFQKIISSFVCGLCGLVFVRGSTDLKPNILAPPGGLLESTPSLDLTSTRLSTCDCRRRTDPIGVFDLREITGGVLLDNWTFGYTPNRGIATIFREVHIR